MSGIIKTKVVTRKYSEGWDRIFAKDGEPAKNYLDEEKSPREWFLVFGETGNLLALVENKYPKGYQALPMIPDADQVVRVREVR